MEKMLAVLKEKLKNRNFRISFSTAACLLAIVLVWSFVGVIGSNSQAVAEEKTVEKKAADTEKVDVSKLSPWEKAQRKMPLTREEKKQLVKELKGDFSNFNTKPVEDKGF